MAGWSLKKIRSKSLPGSKIGSTVLFGRHLKIKKRSLLLTELTSLFSKAMDEVTVALNSVIPGP